MEILTKSGMGMLLVIVAASTALLAQSGPDMPQKQPSVADVRQIVSPSVVATERRWQARDHYTYTERDEDRRLTTQGKVKSENVDVSRIIVLLQRRVRCTNVLPRISLFLLPDVLTPWCSTSTLRSLI